MYMKNIHERHVHVPASWVMCFLRPSCACLPPPPLAAAANFAFKGEPIDQQIGLQREARNRGFAHG